MNILSTAVAVGYRGLSGTPQTLAPSLFTALRKFSAVPDTEQAKEEENDVLYKMCEVECRGVDPAVLRSYSTFTQKAARHLGITIGECITPKKPHIKRWSMLKSVFIYAKAQAQYEVRTYHHTMQFLKLTGSTADTFLEYIERNLPEGVALKVTRVRLERLPDHLRTAPDLMSPDEKSLPDESPTKETTN